ncbi:MAG: 2Fe-2S iron-sulfur cluster binding domain-containing protein [Caldithrix sp.]|nr:MAG: 2Fe-2S iron-sulfur cluster binding domain-containing protein [Caldithrix sp.]
MKVPQEEKNLPEHSNGISRRSFLKGFGVTSAGVAVTPVSELLTQLGETATKAEGKLLGPDAANITLTVNGKKMTALAAPRMTLVDVLRDQLHLTGTKVGCDRGACGACTVILNGKSVPSCMTLAVDAIGKNIETVEGLGDYDGKLHEIQESFIEHDGLQCGFCTSGMLMSCKNLLDNNPNPSLDEIKIATSGNLCRCGTYPKVFEAVMAMNK